LSFPPDDGHQSLFLNGPHWVVLIQPPDTADDDVQFIGQGPFAPGHV